MPTVSDKLHIYSDMNSYEYQFRVRQPFSTTWHEFILADFDIDRSNEHIVGEATFVVRFASNKFTANDINSYIPEYAELEFIVTTKGSDGTAFASFSRRYFHGHMYRVELERDRAILKCNDPLMALARTYFDYGNMDADVNNIKPVDALTQPSDHADQVPDTAIKIEKITENGEERWVIPWQRLGVTTPEYQKAYVNDSGDADYGGAGTWRAGINRRQFRSIGRMFDTGMDLHNPPNDFGQAISYTFNGPPSSGSDTYSRGNPIPNDYYQIGTDLGNYIEFLDYTPVGDIYLEFVEVYVEGTNDIEHIFQKAVNPRIQGRCSTGSAVGTIVALRSRFIRDAILIGAKVKVLGAADGTAVNVTGVTDQTTITTDGATVWADDVEFEIFNGVEHAPRWIEGTHFNATSANYDVRTIWPSLTTINSIQWNRNNGSALKLMETILNENAAPNYRLWYHPTLKMVRMQYVEQTPFNTGTPNYSAGSFPYGAFVTGAFTPPYDAEDDFHQLTVLTASASPRDEDTFYSQIVVEGVNEHAKNLLKEPEIKIYTWPPGDADPAGGWEFGAGALAGTWKAIRKTGAGPFYTYAEILATDYVDIKDQNIDTIIGWYKDNPDEDEINTFAPYMVIDLGQRTEVGHIKIFTPDTRRDFQWGVRLQCCDENGLAVTSGQTHYNPAASWQLMHPDWYNQRVNPMNEYRIDTGWLKNTCRYILVSMTWAKVHLRATHNLGLADIVVLTRDIVTGSARVTDLRQMRTRGTATNVVTGADVQVTDAAGAFIVNGVTVGDEVFNTSKGFRGVITARTATTFNLAHVSGFSWAIGDTFAIRPWAKRTGLWTYWDGDGLDDAVFTLNMPIVYQQTVGGNSSAWIGAAQEWRVNHRTAYYQDHSISRTQNCALRAAEILIETVRTYQVSNVESRWHAAVDLYETALIQDPRLGIALKCLCEHVRITPRGLAIDASTYGNTAWTGEAPEEIPA